jgi:LPS export ABC transporter protein LptC
MKKIIFFLFIIVILIVLISLGYREDDLRISPSYKSSSMHGLHLTHKARDEIKWELKAQVATFPEGATEIDINSLELNIYGDYRINLTAGSGTYRIDRKTLTINRPVQINIRDATLLTDTLTWDGENGLIKTDEAITFSGKNFRIQGRGLEAEIRYERIRILNDVKGTFYL